jgi:ubiquinone/menaquinone biosynthesis C-methylase UbiE
LARELHRYRDQVLDNAQIGPGTTLLDVGCGDGLVGFGALDRVGSDGGVVFLDISGDLLKRCRQTAESLGALDRCDFVEGSADNLSAIQPESVDVVTTRSVLIYVTAKADCFKEFFRVLRRGGRLSIGEPINRFCYPEPPGRLRGYDVGPIQPLAAKVAAVYRRLQPAETDPMLDFDERDLLLLTEQVGFSEVHLDYRAIIDNEPPKEDWDTFYGRAGNPKIPTLKEATEDALTLEEREQFVAHLQPLVEQGKGTSREAFAYLWARKT